MDKMYNYTVRLTFVKGIVNSNIAEEQFHTAPEAREFVRHIRALGHFYMERIKNIEIIVNEYTKSNETILYTEDK